jgi:hypothetical protein
VSTPDPERLLAEALRAQAVQHPMPDPARPAGPGSSDVGLRLFSDSPYGLLSGQDSVYSIEPPPAPRDTPHTTRMTAARPLSVWWIVLLAVLLGLAAGAVVGLVSVL